MDESIEDIKQKAFLKDYADYYDRMHGYED